MLAQGIIEPATGPWASNIVLAGKKDWTLRCCIDFRQLNEITKKDAYPLPRSDQCLDALNGSSWYSTLDMRGGFHQQMLAPEDSDKTAFITRRGMYKFRTMPFGLCNAVASFQRLMDLALSGLKFEICLVYLDGIIVHSKTQEEHLQRLDKLFRRLKEINLKLKPSKCTLMQRKIPFLGHIVTGNGIATDPEKTKLIEDWPRPKNLKELRGYLGLCGYYRKFVQGFSHIAAPLNKLLRKDQPYHWTEECQESFEALKKALMQLPVLALPNDTDRFILDTDAAEDSVGAVLSQVLNGEERVVAFSGRKLNRNEVNYCITRKELLAVIHFVKHFRQYLLRRTFTIRTDHDALSWLKKTPEPIGQNARWLEQLGEYDFVICHRKGTSHSNADAMSRHPCLHRPSCIACHPPKELGSVNTEDSGQKRTTGLFDSRRDENSAISGRNSTSRLTQGQRNVDSEANRQKMAFSGRNLTTGQKVTDGVKSDVATHGSVHKLDISRQALDLIQSATEEAGDEKCLFWSSDEEIIDENTDSEDGGEYYMQSGHDAASVCTSERPFKCRCCNRLVAEDIVDAGTENQATDMLGWSIEDIRTAQQQDCEIRIITDLLSTHSERP